MSELTTNRHILAFSGHKQAGKNACSNFIHAISFVMEPLRFTNKAFVDPDGQLVVGTGDGDKVFNLNDKSDDFTDFMREHVWPFIKQMAFADPLKEFCVNVLGLTQDQVYGTDEQKNELTDLLWQNFPVEVLEDYKVKGKVEKRKKTGRMTAREVMQYWGTEIFRRQNPDIWAENMVRRIKKSDPIMTVITDLRFPNEFDAIKKLGGKIIRLTRSPLEDTHVSECELDADKFDHSRFDAIIDNVNLTLDETHEQLYKFLVEWEVIKEDK